MDGVVVLPVEPAVAPDEVELHEVRPVDAILVHVDEVRVANGEVERHLSGVVRPLVDAVVVEIRVDPQEEERCFGGADDDAAARFRRLLASDGASVTAEVVEGARDEDVEVEVDATVLHEDLDAVDVRVRRVVERFLDLLAKQRQRWIATVDLYIRYLIIRLPS